MRRPLPLPLPLPLLLLRLRPLLRPPPLLLKLLLPLPLRRILKSESQMWNNTLTTSLHRLMESSQASPVQATTAS